MKIALIFPLIFVVLFLGAQDLKTFPLSNGTSTLISGLETFGEDDYIMFERVITDNLDSIYTKVVHLDADLEILKEIEFEDVNIYSVLDRNDTVFLFGKTNAAHVDGANNWGVWALDRLFNLSRHQSWNFTNASVDNFIYNSVQYKNNKYYLLLTGDEESTCDVVILNENFALLEDFRPQGDIRQGTSIAVGDSTFAISASSIYVYDKDWIIIKKVEIPDEIEPLPNGRLGFGPGPFKYVVFANGHYITMSDAYSDSLSMASGRPELFTDLQLYSVFIEEDATASVPIVFGDHAWDEVVQYNWQSILDIGYGDLLVLGRTHPYEEVGSRSQLLAVRAKNDFTFPSKNNRFGDENKYYLSLGGSYFATRKEALVYGVYHNCLPCPKLGNFLLRLRGDALATSVMNFDEPKAMNVFPNPVLSQGVISIGWNGMEKQSWQIALYDKGGRLVYKTIVEQGRAEVSINLPELTIGVYAIRATGDDNQVYTELVVVK